jgi:hypothetical protein
MEEFELDLDHVVEALAYRRAASRAALQYPEPGHRRMYRAAIRSMYPSHRMEGVAVRQKIDPRQLFWVWRRHHRGVNSGAIPT